MNVVKPEQIEVLEGTVRERGAYRIVWMAGTALLVNLAMQPGKAVFIVHDNGELWVEQEGTRTNAKFPPEYWRKIKNAA